MEAKFEIKKKSYFINGDEDQMKTKKERFILHVIKIDFKDGVKHVGLNL